MLKQAVIVLLLYLCDRSAK